MSNGVILHRSFFLIENVALQAGGLMSQQQHRVNSLPAAWVGRGLGVVGAWGGHPYPRVPTLPLSRRPGALCPWSWFLNL